MYYNQDRNKIKSYFKLSKIDKNYDDIVIHLRLTDYWWSRNRSVIHPDWYVEILKKEQYRNCFIVVEPHKTNQKYLGMLQQKVRRSKVVSNSPSVDFKFIRQFDRIICSNSTFAWWAAFLSDASKIWTFEKWMNKANMNLAYMDGSTVVPGNFIQDNKLAAIDWTDYWNWPK